MRKTNRGPRTAQAVMAVVLALALLGATVGTAVGVNPWDGGVPTGPVVAPGDDVGVNVLEPAGPTAASSGTVGQGGDVERQVRDWNPTGGGKGGGPKGSPKG